MMSTQELNVKVNRNDCNRIGIAIASELKLDADALNNLQTSLYEAGIRSMISKSLSEYEFKNVSAENINGMVQTLLAYPEELDEKVVDDVVCNMAML